MPPSGFGLLVLDLSRSRRRERELATQLREAGYRVQTVRQLERAVPSLRRRTVRLVLLLPGRRSASGLHDILRKLQEVEPRAPVIVLSDQPHLEEAAQALRGRAFDYLDAKETNGSVLGAIERACSEYGFARSPEEQLAEAVGERLRAARQERDLTLQEIAERTGLSVSQISQVERAKNQASLATLLKLSDALRMRLTEIVDGF